MSPTWSNNYAKHNQRTPHLVLFHAWYHAIVLVQHNWSKKGRRKRKYIESRINIHINYIDFGTRYTKFIILLQISKTDVCFKD